MKTFGSDLTDGGLNGNVVGWKNLCQKVGFNVYYYNTIFFPVNPRTNRSKVFCFAEVVEWKIDGVVDVSELVYVIES